MKNTIAEVKLSYKPTQIQQTQIMSSQDAQDVFRNIWDEHISYKESLYILVLNRANKVLGYHLLSTGGTAGTVVDIKIIMQLLILSNAHGFIIAHNHPSGNTKPSIEDSILTKKVKEASKLLEIQLLDHIILTADSFLSMADEGNLN